MDNRNKLLASAARNIADWHEASLKPLGIECRRTPGLWYQQSAGPVIYLNSVTLASVREYPGIMDEIAEMASVYGSAGFSFLDSWAELDLTTLGFRKMDLEPWYFRFPAPMPAAEFPPGLAIEEVSDAGTLREFEQATWDGFESGSPVREAGLGGQHHPGTLEQSAMHYFVGRLNGKVVSSSIAYTSDDVLGVFGVSTLPEYRSRGFGEALTWAATLVAPNLPAHLEPSETGAAMYRRMGYEDIGKNAHWFRPAAAD